MSQIFQVLRCYKCFIFQIHQRKKSNKWQCKICSEKQSVKRHYGIGTGKECRMHVQKLNKMQGDQHKSSEISSSDTEGEEPCNIPLDTVKSKNNSKWSQYIENSDDLEVTPINAAKRSKTTYTDIENNCNSSNVTIDNLLDDQKSKHEGKNFNLSLKSRYSEPISKINIQSVSNKNDLGVIPKEQCYGETIHKTNKSLFRKQNVSKWTNFVDSEQDCTINESLSDCNNKYSVNEANTTMPDGCNSLEVKLCLNIDKHNLEVNNFLFSITDYKDIDNILDI
ncbi:unnamed protein product [Leptosia nina]|uniref:MRN complex-interacting protein N-terminal domain-containing protein n=1 Tax=Leptosia nina TaxID=320188 RepID=A0AAV1JGH3_9NEOP